MNHFRTLEKIYNGKELCVDYRASFYFYSVTTALAISDFKKLELRVYNIFLVGVDI